MGTNGIDRIDMMNRYIEHGLYEIIDGGIYNFGDLVVCGEKYKEAAMYLSECMKNVSNFEESARIQSNAERIYGVAIHCSTDAYVKDILNK